MESTQQTTHLWDVPFKCHYDDCDTMVTYSETNGRILCMPCQLSKTEHPQKMTSAGFPVDELLHPLMEWFIKNEISTENSCQDQSVYGKEKNVWICFSHMDDVHRFLQMANKNDADFENLYLTKFTIDAVCGCDDEYDEGRLQVFTTWKFPCEKLDMITHAVIAWSEERSLGCSAEQSKHCSR